MLAATSTFSVSSIDERIDVRLLTDDHAADRGNDGAAFQIDLGRTQLCRGELFGSLQSQTA